MKVTIISDNTVYLPELKKEWGFSCLVEVEGTAPILFDTGASSSVLLYNMKKLNISPEIIESIFISHDHWDHTGGINGFTKYNSNTKLYIPESFSLLDEIKVNEIIRVKNAIKISENVYSTGELGGIEQSLIVKSNDGVVVIAGCSHPGVREIIRAAQKHGEVIALIGGLHGFRDFDIVKNIKLICATHCTQYKEKIRELYKEKFISGGSGRKITI